MTDEPQTGDFFFPQKDCAHLREILVCVRGLEHGISKGISLWAAYEPYNPKSNFKRWEAKTTKEGYHRPIDISGDIIEGDILPKGYTPMKSCHTLKTVDLLEYLKEEDRWNPLHHYLTKEKLAYPFGKST